MPGRATAPNQTPSSTTSPSTETHWASAPAGIDVAVDARAELHADGQAVGEPEGEVEAGGVVGGVGEPRGRAARVVRRAGSSQAPSMPAEVDVLGACVQHAHRGERREVVGGDRRGHLVGLDGGHLEVERRHREGVAADAAAEVGDVLDARARRTGRRAAPRPAAGSPARGPASVNSMRDGERRRTSPWPACRSLAWLSTAATSPGGWPCLRSSATMRTTSAFASHAGRRVEQPQPLGREQLDELGAIHPATLAPARHAHAGRLALTLHECQIAT